MTTKVRLPLLNNDKGFKYTKLSDFKALVCSKMFQKIAMLVGTKKAKSWNITSSPN